MKRARSLIAACTLVAGTVAFASSAQAVRVDVKLTGVLNMTFSLNSFQSARLAPIHDIVLEGVPVPGDGFISMGYASVGGGFYLSVPGFLSPNFYGNNDALFEGDLFGTYHILTGTYGFTPILCDNCGDENPPPKVEFVTLEPTPIPPALPLLAAALTALGVVGWRRKTEIALPPDALPSP
jgi:hypothetical protein